MRVQILHTYPGNFTEFPKFSVQSLIGATEKRWV